MAPDVLPLGTARVILVDPARVTKERTDWLSSVEREQAARFRFPDDARRWSACRAALRGVLGDALGIDPAAVAFGFGELGKPRLAPPGPAALWFNLSHCLDLALVALCRDGEVGVDVEPRDRAPGLAGCEDAFCHPEEIARLPEPGAARESRLMEIWTAKEALLKATGTGMSIPPQSVSVEDAPSGFAGDPRFKDFRLHRLDEPGLERHFAWLAAPRGVEQVEMGRWPAG